MDSLGRRPLLSILACAFAVTIVVLTGCADSGSPESEAAESPKLLDGLGSQVHPISTSSSLAQRYFNQGMILAFGFNHEAAIRSFEEAARLDPKCAMCRWGIALALGPNINLPMGPEAAARAHAEAQLAMDLRAGATPRERAYIEALAQRYVATPTDSRGDLDLAYANAMRTVHEAEPGDIDAAVLFAESLMDLYPWSYWTEEKKPREHTQEIVDMLEHVMETNPEHVGANHYYIHAVEEYFPERAVAAADRLGDLAPAAGHLVHMPSHIYWRVGRYADATEINQRAVKADEEYFSWCRPGSFYRAAYYPHNLHFLWAAAVAEGRRDLALTTARKLAASTSAAVAEAPFVQEFMAIPMLTLARFGLFDELLAEPSPLPEHIYLVGIHHYTRGLSHARAGKLDESRAELDDLQKAAATDAAETLLLAGGTSTARALLEIASAHLAGEIAAAAGEPDDAIASLRLADERHAALVYMEPPPWYLSPRLALGAVLLEQGKAAEAETTYRADLAQYPNNGWSLFGLAKALASLGDQVNAERAQAEFEMAFANSDIELVSSRF